MSPNRLVFLLLFISYTADVLFAHLDIDDILSVKLMPMSLLMLDNHSKVVSSKSDDGLRNTTSSMAEPNHNGSFEIAYSTMGFHRFNQVLF